MYIIINTVSANIDRHRFAGRIGQQLIQQPASPTISLTKQTSQPNEVSSRAPLRIDGMRVHQRAHGSRKRRL